MSNENEAKLSRRECIVAAALAGAGAAASAARAQGEPEEPLAPIAPPAGRVQVAVLLGHGAVMIDFAGPWEAFQDAETYQNAVAEKESGRGFDLFTVAPTLDPVTVSGGMEIAPKYSFETAPQAQVIVIPALNGGRVENEGTAAKVDWLIRAQEDADVVLAVCTGMFLLGRTGLLDGLAATTHHDFYDEFEDVFPNVRLLRDRRWVDNGKMITAGGLTSGVDAALHVVARYYGVHSAAACADFMEHDGAGWLTGRRGA